MQLSEELTRVITATGRLLTDDRGEDLSRTDFLVLARLSGDEGVEAVRSRDLADAEGVDPSTMSRRLASLVARDLITREPDAADRRASLVRLTPAGARAVQRERARRVTLITDALDGWDEGDRAELARLLSKLTDALEARRRQR